MNPYHGIDVRLKIAKVDYDRLTALAKRISEKTGVVVTERDLIRKAVRSFYSTEEINKLDMVFN